jgi:hypothetical protein
VTKAWSSEEVVRVEAVEYGSAEDGEFLGYGMERQRLYTFSRPS